MMKNAAFFYVNGIPTNGIWIELDDVSDWDDIKAALVKAKLCTADYGGDILVACADFLAGPFLGSSDTFDLESYIECRDAAGTDEAKIAYMQCFGTWNTEHFSDKYVGEGSSDQDFIEDYLDETGWLEGIPAKVRGYIDWAAITRDYMISDFTAHGGHYFYSN